MKRYSLLPRNILRRPEIRALVPDLKLLFLTVYISCETHIGAYLPGGIGEDSGLDAEALAGGLRDLVRRELIEFDATTGEVFIRCFFRDNHFNTDARKGQARDDFLRLSSQRLRQSILKAIVVSHECGLTPIIIEPLQTTPKRKRKPGVKPKENTTAKKKGTIPKNQTATPIGVAAGVDLKKQQQTAKDDATQAKHRPAAAAFSNNDKLRRVRPSGIVTFYEPSDVEAACEIESDSTLEEITTACTEVKQRGQEPTPGLVAKIIEKIRISAAANTKAKADAIALAAKDAAEQDPAAKSRLAMKVRAAPLRKYLNGIFNEAL